MRGNGEPLAVLFGPNVSEEIVASEIRFAMPALFVLAHSYDGGVSKKPDLDVVQIQRFVCAALHVFYRIRLGIDLIIRGAAKIIGKETIDCAVSFFTIAATHSFSRSVITFVVSSAAAETVGPVDGFGGELPPLQDTVKRINAAPASSRCMLDLLCLHVIAARCCT